jgi:hypothetical protein
MNTEVSPQSIRFVSERDDMWISAIHGGYGAIERVAR